MADFFYHHLSSEDQEQYVAKFLKILESLEENALSYLFQKGVFPGDARHHEYERQVCDEKQRESLIKGLLRPGDKVSLDEDTQKQIAVLLLKLCNEASQLFAEIGSHTQSQSSALCAVIALGYHTALIDRISGFLNLPSINDKAFWRLLSVKVSSTPPVKAPPVPHRETTSAPISPPPPPSVASPAPNTPTPKTDRINASRAPQDSNVKSNMNAAMKTSPVPTLNKSSLNASSLNKSSLKKSSLKKSNRPSPKKTEAPDSTAVAKPEGPIKAMLRRIVKEIRNDSYDAVINALKDSAMMSDLYKTTDDPITVKIIEVNTKERVVHLIKQKMAPVEPVTFRLIRKLLAEL